MTRHLLEVEEELSQRREAQRRREKALVDASSAIQKRFPSFVWEVNPWVTMRRVYRAELRLADQRRLLLSAIEQGEDYWAGTARIAWLGGGFGDEFIVNASATSTTPVAALEDALTNLARDLDVVSDGIKRVLYAPLSKEAL